MNVNKVVNWLLNGKTVLALAVFTLLMVIQIPLALSDSPPNGTSAGFPVPQVEENGNNPYGSRQKFKQHVKDKYKQIDDAESDVKQTQHGFSGHMTFSGDIVPQKKTEIDLTKEKDRHVRARAISKAFMDDEPALLGITNPDEIRETNISTSNGFGGDYTHISYHRYINGIKLQGAGIYVTIGPEETIKHISADLAPVPPEVYEATKKKTLSEEEIKSIIEADLTEADKRGYDMNTIYKSFKKVAIIKPPYVKWEVHYIYMYEIDAFTGKILSKISPIIKEPRMPKEDSGTSEPTIAPDLPPM